MYFEAEEEVGKNEQNENFHVGFLNFKKDNGTNRVDLALE